MNKNQQIKEIINILKIKNVLNIKEPTNRLNVSEMIIRRDLNFLSKDKIEELIPGGAILKSSVDSETFEEKYLITNEETR